MLRVLCVSLLVAASGCSALVDSDVGSLGRRPVACSQASRPLECACPGGGRGEQVCNKDGKYDPCQCDVPAAGNGG